MATKIPTSEPTATLRRVIASAIVSGYGYLLFIVWATPLYLLSMESIKESPRLAWTAIALMAVVLLGFQLLPRRLYDLHKFERDGRFYRRLGVRRIRFFAGRGEGIQRLARVVDPHWQNPLAKLSPEEWTNWTRLTEGLHWAFLIGSTPLIVLAVHFRFTTFAALILIFNVPINVYSIILQRYTRAKLARISELRANRQPVSSNP